MRDVFHEGSVDLKSPGPSAIGDTEAALIREGLEGQVACPFCGVVSDGRQTICPKCTMENTAVARKATKQRIGPWYVLQNRNPAAPGMKWETLLAFVRKRRVKPQSIVRGPTTHQLWRFAAHVKGLSREFGVCYSCGGSVEREANVCPHCNRLQEPPVNPDTLLETSEAEARLPVFKEISPEQIEQPSSLQAAPAVAEAEIEALRQKREQEEALAREQREAIERERQSVAMEREAAQRELERARHEQEAISLERQTAAKEKELIDKDRSAMAREREAIRQDREAAANAARDAAAARDAVAREIATLRESALREAAATREAAHAESAAARDAATAREAALAREVAAARDAVAREAALAREAVARESAARQAAEAREAMAREAAARESAAREGAAHESSAHPAAVEASAGRAGGEVENRPSPAAVPQAAAAREADVAAAPSAFDPSEPTVWDMADHSAPRRGGSPAPSLSKAPAAGLADAQRPRARDSFLSPKDLAAAFKLNLAPAEDYDIAAKHSEAPTPPPPVETNLFSLEDLPAPQRSGGGKLLLLVVVLVATAVIAVAVIPGARERLFDVIGKPNSAKLADAGKSASPRDDLPEPDDSVPPPAILPSPRPTVPGPQTRPANSAHTAFPATPTTAPSDLTGLPAAASPREIAQGKALYEQAQQAEKRLDYPEAVRLLEQLQKLPTTAWPIDADKLTFELELYRLQSKK